jgi:hypothetical protein
MRREAIVALSAAFLLSACGGSGGPVKSASAKPPKASAAAPSPASVRPPTRYRPRNPQAQMLPGLEGVIGADEAALLRLFGPARLNVWEGDARKLQFAGTACVLDVFLYPAEQGGDPEATYVDARRASDGQDVDRAACIAALKAKR